MPLATLVVQAVGVSRSATPAVRRDGQRYQRFTIRHGPQPCFRRPGRRAVGVQPETWPAPCPAVRRLPHAARGRRPGRAANAGATAHGTGSRRSALRRRREARAATLCGQDLTVTSAARCQACGAMCSARSSAISRCAVRMVMVKPPITSTKLSAISIRKVEVAARGTAMKTMTIAMKRIKDST
jgi:hypothetical protein